MGAPRCFYFCYPSLIKSCLFEEPTVISSPTRPMFRASQRSVLVFLGAFAPFYSQHAGAQVNPDFVSQFSHFPPRTQVPEPPYLATQLSANVHPHKPRTHTG